MGLSRLDNFLKSARGTILYVNPNDLDATDSIENRGNSLTRPFKTIQRALIESARFSYQKGLDNDRFGKTTILLYPGEHVVDNRPGWIPDGSNNYRLRSGAQSSDLPAYDLTTNFDLNSPNNELYKLNSVYGGVIIPRGTSLVGLDLRKTKIRPKYVPNPTNADIPRSALFRVTGGCYFWQFSMFDANPNGKCYVDYTANEFVPNFSHHKLTCFEYADGVNGVDINDTFMTFSTTRTDLDMYYEKVSLVYGQSSGRAIEPDYPSTGLDIQPKIDEYRIVGSTGKSVGITSIRAGDGVTSSTTITVTMDSAITGLDVDTPFRIQGITASGYDGQFVVSERPTTTQVQYTVQNSPATPLPSVVGATLTLTSDTVTSSSPYVFNCSLRSVYGMCGMVADGKKATGFRSMVVAQFTGIGLQKDDNAFVIYNNDTPRTGQYDDNTVAGNENLSTNSKAVYKPDYRNWHIKVTNDAFIQSVSIFAIGYAEHFVVENGGDMSLTNSNSNFGAKALAGIGFKNNAFAQDDMGYITHIIPPKEIPLTTSAIEFESIDVNKTGVVGVASTAHLYLYGKTNEDVLPENVIEGYRVGAKPGDELKVFINEAGISSEYKSRIVMPGSQSSYEKSFTVNQSVTGINSIGAFSAGGNLNEITFTEVPSFLTGETVRVISDTGQVPDGLDNNSIYHAIIYIDGSAGVSTNTNIKLAKTLNDALDGTALSINNKGGLLKVVSRVSDKNSGDIGHPVQWDTTNNQWFINVAAAATENTIYSAIIGIGSTGLGDATPRTFITRKSDTRNSVDTIYRARYVIPSSAGGKVGRPPSDGFILQESNASIGSTDGEIQTYFGSGSLTNENQQRNFKFIAGANWSGGSVNIQTELPHHLSVGSEVELVNVKSSVNTVGAANSGYNRTYSVTGISSAKCFSVGMSTNPGTFTNDTSARNTSLPYFKRKRYDDIYFVFRNEEAQPYVSGEQDGVYYLTLLNASNKPTVTPFTNENFSQPVKELYPQTNRDNPNADPEETKSFARSQLIGDVVVSDVRNSITKETLNKFVKDTEIGIGITDLSSATGTAHTITTINEHGLNRITQVSIADSGRGYGSGTGGSLYNARLVSIGNSVTGEHATAKVTVDAIGGITAVQIMDGGSAYGIGNTLAVVGVGTTANYEQAVLTVDKIYNNVGDVVKISGVGSEAYAGYNNLYRVTSVDVGWAYSFRATSATTVPNYSESGIGVTYASSAYFYETGEAIKVNTLTYDNASGIATVTTHNNHGLKADHKITVTGAGEAVYNGSFVVKENISLTSFSMNLGVTTNAPSVTGTLYAYREGYASNEGNITPDNENLSGRMVTTYAGITTTLSAEILNATTSEINIQNIANLDVNIGDYFTIDNEIVRVKTTVTGNPVQVFRGVLGSKPKSHLINSTVRRISMNPVELRRHSIIRASGHTFEYVGFGPGNYSTAFPEKQDRALSAKQELLAQSIKKQGGAVFYTGMNDQGISYNGNKKLSAFTGQEEIIDTPVQTITGEDIGNLPDLNVINATEASFSRSIKVEGGPDSKVASEFNGPIIVNNKFTSVSTKGIEAQSYYVQGDQTISRKYTLSDSAPVLSGNPGDITYYSDPTDGGFIGWVYSANGNDWRRFGDVSLSKDADISVFDQVGVGTTTPGTYTFQVGAGSSIISIDGTGGVGIGTTNVGDYKFYVNGNSNIIGTCYATSFSGDGAGLINLNASSFGWTNYVSGGSSITYNSNVASGGKVGIGTSSPRYDFEVGQVGSATTTIYVNGEAQFVGIISANNIGVSGIITASSYDFQNSSTGRISAGIVTATTINVGTGATTLMTEGANVGIGTTNPRAKFDIAGHTRFQTYSEGTQALSIVGTEVAVYLDRAQTFTLTPNGNIERFRLYNVPSGSTSFTIKVQQQGSGSGSPQGVGINTFHVGAGSTFRVYWPGGVVPVVTEVNDAIDIYSFKIFDGDNIATGGMYGVIGGQNYS